MTRIFTGAGDDGTTGLLYGGRIAKDHSVAHAVGDVDEAQAAIGVARACARDRINDLDEVAIAELDALLVARQRDLWVVMAELAAGAGNRHKLVAGQTSVTKDMVRVVEVEIERLSGRFAEIRDFVVPGQNVLAAALDLARTVVRRSERSAVTCLRDGEAGGPSNVIPYLNRLSALLWAAARAHEGEALITRGTENPC